MNHFTPPTPAKPAVQMTGKRATTNWLQKVKAVLVGPEPGQFQLRQDPDEPGPAVDPAFSHEARRGPRPRTQLIYEALAEAAADFEYNDVRPLRELVPGTRFVLEQIRTVCTPEGLAFMGDVIGLKRAHRNKAVISKIGGLGFDLSQFCDWRIEAQSSDTALLDAAAEGEVLTVIAGDGPYRVKLNFQFFGRFDEVEVPEPALESMPTPRNSGATQPVPEASPTTSMAHNPPMAAQAMQDAPRPAQYAAAATLVAMPVTKGSRAATLLDDSGAHPGAARRPLARLRLTTHDGHEQLVDITQLPFEIGREPEIDAACTVPEAAARVSRVHLRLEKMQAGALLVHNTAHHRSGTWCGGDKLDERFTLTPVPLQSKGGWHILGERNLGANSVAMRIEQAA